MVAVAQIMTIRDFQLCRGWPCRPGTAINWAKLTGYGPWNGQQVENSKGFPTKPSRVKYGYHTKRYKR